MKKATSIKTRITIWYTMLMLAMIAVVLTLVGTLSYQLSLDNVEKSVKLQVTQISEKLETRQRDVFESIDDDEEFKNVSVYSMDQKHIAGQYSYDIANIAFREGEPRRETVGEKEYIVYDVFKHGAPGERNGFWIRGAESVNSTVLLGRSAIVVTLVVIPLILILTAWGGYYITKKAFLPIYGIIQTANEIAAQKDVSRRIEIVPNAREDELYHLSVTLNRMLGKIEHLILQEKRFTSDASHELRTPVSVILAQGEYLLDIAQTEKERELSQSIVDQAKQVSKLISHLLLLTRMDQNRQAFHKEKVDLGVLADIVVDTQMSVAEKKGILLLTSVEENTIVDADEALLLSAMNNLVSNGIKYGKDSGYVSISATKVNGRTEIIVADNGIGIPKENLEQIWERFFRIDSVRNDEYGSCGLGLAVVKSIVELHGGSIFVESEYGAGTRFTILL